MEWIDGYLAARIYSGDFYIVFGLCGEAAEYGLPEQGWTFCVDFVHGGFNHIRGGL